MPPAGPRMEVLTESGFRDQAHKIIVQPPGQFVMPMHLEPARECASGKEPM